MCYLQIIIYLFIYYLKSGAERLVLKWCLALGSVEPLKFQAHLWWEGSRSQWEAQAMAEWKEERGWSFIACEVGGKGAGHYEKA